MATFHDISSSFQQVMLAMLRLFARFPKFSTGFEKLSKDEKHCTVSYYLFETF